jgi:uncharacterized membrane protein
MQQAAELVQILFPTDDEPVLERLLIKASANINNQVLPASSQLQITVTVTLVQFSVMCCAVVCMITALVVLFAYMR